MSNGEEFRFKVDAYTPETMPMERLAEYLAELAKVLGERNAVHCVQIEGGSVIPVIKIDREATPKVRIRAASVQRGTGPIDALRAYRVMNHMLRADNGVGVLVEESGAEIIRFPGREQEVETFQGIRQRGSLDGEIVRVGGTARYIPLTLQSEKRIISRCYTTRPVAKALGRRLFEPVRLYGTGTWTRDDLQAWTLERFYVDQFEVLDDAPLSSALVALRAIKGGEWGPDSVREMEELRRGPDEALQ